jgi:tellurite resistance protein
VADFFVSKLGRASSPSADVRGNALNWSSLFEQSESQPVEELSIPEAFITVLFAAVMADGEMSSEEHEEMLALVHRSRALKTLKQEQLVEINRRVVARLRDDENALQAACAALPQDARAPVFAHALDLVLADGELSEDEADFLNGLILHLDLPGEEVERIADVMALKNSY